MFATSKKQEGKRADSRNLILTQSVRMFIFPIVVRSLLLVLPLTSTSSLLDIFHVDCLHFIICVLRDNVHRSVVLTSGQM